MARIMVTVPTPKARETARTKTIVLGKEDFDRALKEIQAEIKAAADEAAIQAIRARYREALGVIYVREYTVKAHVRPWKPARKRRRAVA